MPSKRLRACLLGAALALLGCKGSGAGSGYGNCVNAVADYCSCEANPAWPVNTCDLGENAICYAYHSGPMSGTCLCSAYRCEASKEGCSCSYATTFTYDGGPNDPNPLCEAKPGQTCCASSRIECRCSATPCGSGEQQVTSCDPVAAGVGIAAASGATWVPACDGRAL